MPPKISGYSYNIYITTLSYLRSIFFCSVIKNNQALLQVRVFQTLQVQYSKPEEAEILLHLEALTK